MQNFPASSNESPGNNPRGAAAYNPNFVRKSVRGSRGSKRKLKATLNALRQQTMEIDGCIVPVLEGVFIRNYALRRLINVQEFEVRQRHLFKFVGIVLHVVKSALIGVIQVLDILDLHLATFLTVCTDRY